jgi:hypothetical protein
MKTYKILLFAVLLLGATLAISAFRSSSPKQAAPTENGFAVVELFTSEGCSSCPPADELVAKILKEDKDKPVYILAYHVDYWNHLGWKDPFSSAQYSERQRNYARLLKLESVYTPQIVVNGRTEFVGSQEGSLRNAIHTGLQKTTSDQLTFNHASINGDKLNIQYQTNGNTVNKELVIVIVQKYAQTDVKHGENGGHILSHVNIVRSLTNISLKENCNITVKLPQGYNSNAWEAIGFIQNISTGQILSAQKVLTSNI